MNTAIRNKSLVRKIFLETEEDTIRIAQQLAPHLSGVSLITLSGDLGAGKTTFARALIQALGYEGRVKSPTYALVESYCAHGRDIFHFDLYRVADPEELEYLGLDDYFSPGALCLVEWASKGMGMLPPIDLDLELVAEGEGRILRITPVSDVGLKLIDSVAVP